MGPFSRWSRESCGQRAKVKAQRGATAAVFFGSVVFGVGTLAEAEKGNAGLAYSKTNAFVGVDSPWWQLP